jgi:serine/threonine protein kinase
MICSEGTFHTDSCDNGSRGGYGAVYRGVNEASGESCAIKEMNHDEFFEREVNAMNSIPEHVHPNLSLLTTVEEYPTASRLFKSQ